MKTKIIGTGITGLVGSRVVELLSDKYEFENLSYETGVDITNQGQVKKILSDSPAGLVLHLAAKADVDGCEKDKDEDLKRLKNHTVDQKPNLWQKLNSAWAINVEGTRNIVAACQKTGKKIIYISTDFVFDGKNQPESGYSEEDKPNPINWYAHTKYEGEKLIANAHIPYLICRIAFPYRVNFDLKKDLVRLILSKLQNNERLTMVDDQIIVPTFIDDIASALDTLIGRQEEGIYHMVGSSHHSPFDLALLIAKVFDLDQTLIDKISREEYYLNRASRPFSLFLKNDKLRNLGIKMSTLEEGLKELKKQMNSL